MMKRATANAFITLLLAGSAGAAEPSHFSPDADASRMSWMPLSNLGPAPDVRGHRFGAVIKTYGNGYWRLLAAGYRRQAARDGVKLDVQAAQSETSPGRQLAILETMVGGLYRAILISPQSSSNLQPAIEDAVATGVPLVDVDGAVVDSVQHFVGAVNRDIGAEIAKTGSSGATRRAARSP